MAYWVVADYITKKESTEKSLLSETQFGAVAVWLVMRRSYKLKFEVYTYGVLSANFVAVYKFAFFGVEEVVGVYE